MDWFEIQRQDTLNDISQRTLDTVFERPHKRRFPNQPGATMPGPTDEIDNNTSHTPDPEEVAKSPRMLAMEAINVVREKDEDAPDINAPRQIDQIDLQTGGGDGPRLLSDGLDKTMVKVKVDGVEQDVPVSEVVKSYQFEAAARTRLAEANRILSDARATAAAALPPAKVDGVDTGAETTAASNESLGEFVDTLFEGDKDKAVAALAKLGITGRSNGPIPDLAQLEEQLTPVIRQRLIDDSALEKFRTENADLEQDPHLVEVVNRNITAAVEAGRPYSEALGIGAQKTRDWLTSIGAAKPKPEPTTTATQSSKLERKAGIDEIQTLNRTANTTAAAPQSVSDTIAQMKKARGQE